MKLVDPVGNYVWTPNAGASADSKIPGRLFGLPLLITDQCAALGSVGDIVLGNFGTYGLAMKKEVAFEATDAHKWLEDTFSYRSIWRIDGHPLLHEAITPAHGSDTVSAFVTLE